MQNHMREKIALSIITWCLLLTACNKQAAGGYKIISYSLAKSGPLTAEEFAHAETVQPTFTILYKGVKITAICQDYYGKHVGCDQLKTNVGRTVPETQMGKGPWAGDDSLYYNPYGLSHSCTEVSAPNGDCEFLEVTARQSQP